jgi:hypothetical protein
MILQCYTVIRSDHVEFFFVRMGADANELDWIEELGDANARGEETKGVFVSASYGRTS